MADSPIVWGEGVPAPPKTEFNPWHDPTSTPDEWKAWLKSWLELDEPELILNRSSVVLPSASLYLPTESETGQLAGSGTTVTGEWHIMHVHNPQDMISRGVGLALNRGSSDLDASFAVWDAITNELVAVIDAFTIPKTIGPGNFTIAWDAGDLLIPAGPLWIGATPSSGTGSGWYTRFSGRSPSDFIMPGVTTDGVPDPIDPTDFTVHTESAAFPHFYVENVLAPVFGTAL